MLPDRVSNPGPLTYESGALPIALCGPAKIDVNVRLAGGHLYGKQLFTWLSLVVSLMASFVLSFFPLDVLDEIWDLIESVSEGLFTFSETL